MAPKVQHQVTSNSQEKTCIIALSSLYHTNAIYHVYMRITNGYLNTIIYWHMERGPGWEVWLYSSNLL